ncbi:hypothetical protein A2Z23_02420 [Candidatus Curtissbacteria bacterium RBG_16_39_7]|uniref:Uncharacterized protein n=1 Tax=Candidatus Curtissbacteria bacterium RBG_16_39_7 TaxID=1797707 RepID=A0A1F5G4I7_9BACT|nr:MAG: hypothetical protein A2Z23_02420 [Candidatus Curtissbacteria bacterium RBG_16_39_7]
MEQKDKIEAEQQRTAEIQAQATNFQESTDRFFGRKVLEAKVEEDGVIFQFKGKNWPITTDGSQTVWFKLARPEGKQKKPLVLPEIGGKNEIESGQIESVLVGEEEVFRVTLNQDHYFCRAVALFNLVMGEAHGHLVGLRAEKTRADKPNYVYRSSKSNRFQKLPDGSLTIEVNCPRLDKEKVKGKEEYVMRVEGTITGGEDQQGYEGMVSLYYSPKVNGFKLMSR